LEIPDTGLTTDFLKSEEKKQFK